MRRAAGLLAVFSIGMTPCVGDPPVVEPPWKAILSACDHIEVYTLNPAAVQPWLRGSEPGDPLATLTTALRELDVAYDGSVVPRKFHEFSPAPHLLAALHPLSGSLPPCAPTDGFILGAGEKRLALILDTVKWIGLAVTTQGSVPVRLEGDPRTLERGLGEFFSQLVSHWVLRAAERRLTPRRRAVLENATELTLYAVDPDAWRDPPNLNEALQALENPKHVRGRVSLQRPGSRARIGREVIQALASPATTGMGCWEPRHAVLARQGTRTLLLVICFECHWVHVYETDAPDLDRDLLSNHDLRISLNLLFHNHGVELAPTRAEKLAAEEQAAAEKTKAGEKAK